MSDEPQPALGHASEGEWVTVPRVLDRDMFSAMRKASGEGASTYSDWQDIWEVALFHAPSAPPVERGWLPIESAPKKHGEMILAAFKGGLWMDTICWNEHLCRWQDGMWDDPDEPLAVTHWMPLPAAPVERGE